MRQLSVTGQWRTVAAGALLVLSATGTGCIAPSSSTWAENGPILQPTVRAQSDDVGSLVAQRLEASTVETGGMN